MNKNWKKLTPEDFLYFLSEVAIYLSLGSIKDVQATGEAFSPQKRTSRTSKHEMFVGLFCPPGSGSEFRIRIH
jgi:hypothetical protein